VGTNPVAQDEFVNFLKVNYGADGAPIFFDLDNEPNYWMGTHPEIYPNECDSSTGGMPQGTILWEDVANRNIAAGKAIKAAWSSATVFGPVVSGEGMANGGNWSDPHYVAGTEEFTDYYLEQVSAASVTAGKPLLDILDVHYYTNGQSNDCLLSPRLFWDPNTPDISATEANSMDFQYGDHTYWDTYWYPRQMIPRLFKKIAAAYSGKSTTAPGLSFSEYDTGCDGEIQGGVAEADLLGVFGREGVFAASLWPANGAIWNIVAFDLYRNYDGQGSVVGDTTVSATTTDRVNTSVYAFTHSDTSDAAEVVAINKETSAQAVTIQLTSAPAFKSVTVYNLVAGSPAVVAAAGKAPAVTCSCNECSLSFTMPPTSASTLVLR
jgi:hypothetical protein